MNAQRAYWADTKIIDELIRREAPELDIEAAEVIFGEKDPDIQKKIALRHVIYRAYRLGITENLAEMEGLKNAVKHITITHNHPPFQFISWLKSFFS